MGFIPFDLMKESVRFDRSLPYSDRPRPWHGVYPGCAVRLFDQWWACVAIYMENGVECHELAWIKPQDARAIGLPK